VFSGCDVKDKAVNQVNLVVMGDGNCVVNNVPHRLISVDDSILQIETVTLSEVTFPEAVDSLLIFWVNVSNPEKVVFLDFLVTVAKCLETIRANVKSAQLVVQGVGNEGGVFEKAVVAVDTIFHPDGWLKISLALEAGGCDRGGSHQAFPELRFTLAPLVSSKGGV